MALYSQLFHEPKKLAIIGSGCSVATEPATEVSHFYNITQVSKTANCGLYIFQVILKATIINTIIMSVRTYFIHVEQKAKGVWTKNN